MNNRIINTHTVFAEVAGHHVDFTVYNFVEDPEISEMMTTLPPGKPFMVGYIKWDGCSNWDFLLEENVTHPLHFCSQIQTTQFGNLLYEMYNWAAELMPWNKEWILKK